ncbi:class I SAM-dependent methyltransferase [Candidatus Bathyarchaeota archaeon]|nr:class I SAM-dependent methyltransferase [Candidatus Bathyarchaeota archaeon]
MSDHYFSRRPSSRESLGLVRCRLRGEAFEFLTSPGIFSYKRLDLGTRLLIESMVLLGSGRALDVGCGYGPVGIVAARLEPGLEVWMTDVNERAVRLAERNCERNGVSCVVREGDLYEPVGDALFDVVLSNPPFSAGMRRVVEPLVDGAWDHLVEGGSLQAVVRTNVGGRALWELMEGRFGGVEVLGRGSGFRVLRSVKRGSVD